MKRFLFLQLLLILPFAALATEYEDCILDKMPGVANDMTARAIVMVCKNEYPRILGVDAKKRTGWFDYKSGAECAAKKGKNTSSKLGGAIIFSTCNTLYEPPKYVPFYGKLDGEK